MILITEATRLPGKERLVDVVVKVDALLGRLAAVQGLRDLKEILRVLPESLQVPDYLLVRPVLEVVPEGQEVDGLHGFAVVTATDSATVRCFEHL